MDFPVAVIAALGDPLIGVPSKPTRFMTPQLWEIIELAETLLKQHHELEAIKAHRKLTYDVPRGAIETLMAQGFLKVRDGWFWTDEGLRSDAFARLFRGERIAAQGTPGTLRIKPPKGSLELDGFEPQDGLSEEPF